MSTGYSGKPLAKKLGIREGYRMRAVGAPENYSGLLEDLPPGIAWTGAEAAGLDFIHVFVRNSEELEAHLPVLKDQIHKDGMIWVSWYKKAARIPTDVTEDVIRDMALALGLVDVKVCAVDEKWSALKLVWRRENR